MGVESIKEIPVHCPKDFVFKEREFNLSNQQERGVYNLLDGVDGRFFVEEGESGQSR